MAEKDPEVVTVGDLPITFQVKYLGQHDAGGLWGIKHTRRPVDNMVAAAKNLPQGQILPIVKLVISTEGVHLRSISTHGTKNTNSELSATFSIDSISYGVQDLVYTRVFSMIVVKEGCVQGEIPFTCHAFVCESRSAARALTYALAAAFQEYSRKVKEKQIPNDPESPAPTTIKKKFAIDLRTPEEIEADLEAETEA